jgi:hypothetical protein
MAQAARTLSRVPGTQEQKPSGFVRFLTGHITLMAENGKLTIPYALLGVIVGLFVTIALQTLAGVWWASGLTKEVQATKEMIQMEKLHQKEILEQQQKFEQQQRDEMKRQIETQDVWIKTTRERLDKVELSQRRGG